jgi:lipoyl(octanoyl) transferase
MESCAPLSCANSTDEFMMQTKSDMDFELPGIEWRVSRRPVLYPDAVQIMESRVEGISSGICSEQVWLLEHPPLYTAGTSTKEADILYARLPVYKTGRGGQLTYHGPGQRVAYVMLDLKTRKADVRRFVRDLEEWLILALRKFDVKGERRPGRVGIWVQNAVREEKIAAVGVRIRRWVTFHGVSLNIDPDLSHYSGIVPCGVKEYGVTSLSALGISTNMADVDAALKESFQEIFGPTN